MSNKMKMVSGFAAAALLLVMTGGFAGCSEAGTAEEKDEVVETAISALTPAPGEVCVKLYRGVSGVEDAWIEDSYGYQSVNHGSGALTTGGVTSGKALLKFDLSSIPSTATVTRAFVRLNQTYNGNAPVDAYLVNAPWSEGTVTAASLAGAYAASPFGSVVYGPGPLPSLYFDMVSPLQGWISGGVPNHGIMLGQGLSGQRILASSEDATLGLRPTLELCYVHPCSNVTCTASDQCHDAGVCDVLTGVCSNPPKANGTSCDDHDACTQGDTCQNGACGGSAVQCAPQDACHAAGTCSNGACSNPQLPNGTHCGGNNVCSNGACVAPVCSNPGGSYGQTCFGCSQNGNTLSCSCCLTVNQQCRATSFDVCTCPFNISNCNGVLMCNAC